MNHTPAPTEDLAALARSKLARVLGEGAGQRVYTETMATARLTTLETPNALNRFGELLGKRGGMEAAVGGLQCVAAVVRGADRA